MPTAPSNGIELCYETFGDPDDAPLLLVMGLGAQMIAWHEDFCQALVDRGFYVIRFDNRDVGLSTKVPATDLDVTAALMAALSGEDHPAPYHLWDMADDAVGLLDHLGIASAHVVGASMGGMISQSIAIGHRDRVRSLTSIMSTTGDPDVGMPDPDVLPILMQAGPTEREAAIEHAVGVTRTISGAAHFDEAEARIRATAAYDRSFYPQGTGNQLVAIVTSGSRTEALQALDLPALVIHGEVDRLVNVSGGRRTAEAIDGSELLLFDDMGHDLPQVYWPQIIERITRLAASADVAA